MLKRHSLGRQAGSSAPGRRRWFIWIRPARELPVLVQAQLEQAPPVPVPAQLARALLVPELPQGKEPLPDRKAS